MGQALEELGRAALLDPSATPDHEVLLEAAGVEPEPLDRQADPAVPLEVAHLERAEEVGGDDVLAVETGPDHGHLGAAVGVERDQVDERRRLEQGAGIRVERRHRASLSSPRPTVYNQPRRLNIM